MKYSLAIIALLGLTNAIKIQAEPAASTADAAPAAEAAPAAAAAPAAPAAPDAKAAPAAEAAPAAAAAPAAPAAPDAKAAPAAPDAKAAPAGTTQAEVNTDEAAQKAWDKPVIKNKVDGMVKKILQTEEDKAQEAANMAGQKIDVSNVPVAIEAPAKEKKLDADGKEIKPVPLTQGEQIRNNVVREAATGQEAIANNNNSMNDVKEKWDEKARVQAEETASMHHELAIDADRAAVNAKLEHIAKNDTADERWTASHAVMSAPVKTPILQSTVVYAQESNQSEMDKMIDEKFNPQKYGTQEAKSPFAHSDNQEVQRIQNVAMDSILPYSAYMAKKTE